MGLLCQIAYPDDLVSLQGTTYRNFSVVKVENGFLTISYDEGTATLKADILPEDIRQKYGLGSNVTQPPKHLDKIVLNDGTTYLNVTIGKVLPDSLTILYGDGGAKIPFENLSAAICKLYGITLDQAVQYRESIKQEQELANSNKSPLTKDEIPPSANSATDVSPTYNSGSDTVYVHGYYRKDGTYVNGYTRRK